MMGAKRALKISPSGSLLLELPLLDMAAQAVAAADVDDGGSTYAIEIRKARETLRDG
jgi:hypothetical protein